MATVHVEAEVSVDKLIEAVKQLDSDELERLAAQILVLRAQRKAASLSVDETSLLIKINAGLPGEVSSRYHELIDKRRGETLTDAERAELLDLTAVAEQNQVARLEALSRLAALRGVSLRNLMQTLGIGPAEME